MKLPTIITERLLSIPKTNINIDIVIRTEDDKRNLFSEYTRKDGSKVLSINSSEYLKFSFSNNDIHESVMVSYFNMATLKDGFNELEEFANNSFMMVSGEYAIEPNHTSGYSIKNLINNKSLLFIPKIMLNDNGSQDYGFDMVINNIECSGFVQYDTLFQIIAFIRSFDLYTSSKSLINTAIMYTINNNKESFVINQPSSRNKEK